MGGLWPFIHSEAENGAGRIHSARALWIKGFPQNRGFCGTDKKQPDELAIATTAEV